MDEYRSTVKRRARILGVSASVALVAMVAAGVIAYRIALGSNDGFMHGFNMGVPIGLMVAFCLLAVIQLVRYVRAVKNDDLLRKMQIEEQDERARMIRDKIGGFGFDFSMGLVAVGAVVCSWLNTVAAFTLFCTLFAMSMVKAGLKLYYNTRF